MTDFFIPKMSKHAHSQRGSVQIGPRLSLVMLSITDSSWRHEGDAGVVWPLRQGRVARNATVSLVEAERQTFGNVGRSADETGAEASEEVGPTAPEGGQ